MVNPPTLERPCKASHPDPGVTTGQCRLCWLAQNRGDYQKLWGLPITAPMGPTAPGRSPPQSRVAYCGALGRYRWYVTQEGITLKEGHESTEPEAEDAAEAEIAKLKDFTPIVSLDVGGIGDALCAVAVGTGLGNVRFSPPPNRAEWVRLFADVVDEYELKLSSVEHAAMNSPRWEAWATQMGTRAKLPDLRPLPADALEWSIPYTGRVVLVPYAAHDVRTWPLERWIEVERLLMAKGIRCVILDDGSEHRTAAFKSDKLLSKPAAQVAAVISRSLVLAGNDSGMVHVAGFLRVPSVAVCAHHSDNRIFDLYPTVRQLGGRFAGFYEVKPFDVATAILEQAHTKLGNFPAWEFLSILADGDKWRVEEWLPVYSVLWRTIREINPKRIVEIGTRAGQSAWTMLRACPEATIEAYDIDGNEHGGYRGACEHARRINPERFTLTIQDSHTIDRLPMADVAYVDGEHTFQGCYDDLMLVERSGIPVALVDDAVNLEDIRRAVGRFCRERSIVPTFIPSLTGIFRVDLRH